MLRSGERIVQTLWVGSLWTLGYIVAPMLFAVLDDRALAGMLAGRLFTIGNWLGFVCGMLLLAGLSAHMQMQRRVWLRGGLILMMLAGHALSEFLLRPWMDSARTAGADERFAQLHATSEIIFLIVSAIGLLLVTVADPERIQESS